MRRVVLLDDNYLHVKKRAIAWSKLLGFVRKGARGDRVVLRIEGGRSLRLPPGFVLAIDHGPDGVKEVSGQEAVEELEALVSRRANNLSEVVRGWRSWRCPGTVIVIELLFLIIAILRGRPIERITMLMVVGFFMSLPLGLLWERDARRFAWRISDKDG